MASTTWNQNWGDVCNPSGHDRATTWSDIINTRGEGYMELVSLLQEA